MTRYLNAVGSGTAAGMTAPYVTISANENSGYSGKLTCTLPIYLTRLTSSNLYVAVPEVSYETTPVNPEVTVYYSVDTTAVKKAKGLTNEADILGLGLNKLTAGTDYSVSYGANNKSGKNKGSVTICGTEPQYGGRVTVKYTINGKTIQ